MKLLKNDYIKWSLIVSINAILGFIFALGMLKTVPSVLGLIAAVLSFIFVYVKIDQSLKSRGKEFWRKSLYGGVIISAAVQLWPLITLMLGAMSIDIAKFIFSFNINVATDRNFLSIYVVTIIDGLLLSVFAGIIVLLIRFILEASQRIEKHDS